MAKRSLIVGIVVVEGDRSDAEVDNYILSSGEEGIELRLIGGDTVVFIPKEELEAIFDVFTEGRGKYGHLEE